MKTMIGMVLLLGLVLLLGIKTSCSAQEIPEVAQIRQLLATQQAALDAANVELASMQTAKKADKGIIQSQEEHIKLLQESVKALNISLERLNPPTSSSTTTNQTVVTTIVKTPVNISVPLATPIEGVYIVGGKPCRTEDGNTWCPIGAEAHFYRCDSKGRKEYWMGNGWGGKVCVPARFKDAPLCIHGHHGTCVPCRDSFVYVKGGVLSNGSLVRFDAGVRSIVSVGFQVGGP